MMNKTALRMAVSGIVLCAVTASCSGTGLGRPQNLSDKVERSLEKGDTAQALASAEAAVAVAPRNPQYRQVLAEAYLADGRFVSAAQSYQDALDLGERTAKTVISLALAETARGDFVTAKRVLRENRDVIPASDFGLALALAGDTKEGVDILVGQIRSGANSPKTRQNLAFAYALDGRWREAEIMAAQDLAPDVVKARITQWAQIARPDMHQQRVAALLGVTPSVADPGQPVQLALSNFPEGGQAFAEAAPVETAAETVETVQPVQLASAAAVPPVAPKPVAVPASNAAPVREAAPQRDVPVRVAGAYTGATSAPPVRFVSKEVVQPLPSGTAAPAAPVAAVAKPVTSGSYIVQLGAFSSPANANQAWGKLSSRFGELKGYGNASSRVTANGRTLYRLAAIGFDGAGDANRLCGSIKRKGGTCLVRKVTGSEAADIVKS